MKSIVERPSRRRKYNVTGKKGISSVPLVAPRMDWDRLRRLKVQCRDCKDWSFWNDACRWGLLPDNCPTLEVL